MKTLITSDLHLSDLPKDAYRFDLFTWLAKQQSDYAVDATFILGDLTETKDKHSSILVNQIANGLTRLIPPVFILKGNHDYIDPANPFFRFLNYIEGLTFVVKPRWVTPIGAFIPHCRTQAEFDQACEKIVKNYPLFLHNTFDGAVAETGARLSGLQWAPIEPKRPRGVWAGDVHKPQRCGPVTYVGAPFTVRFGDAYVPRVLLVENGVEKNLYFPCPRKWSLKITDSDDLGHMKELHAGDQVKIEYALTREEVVEWANHKQKVLDVCKDMDLEVFGVEMKVAAGKHRERLRVGDMPKAKTPQEIFAAFCKSENVAGNIKAAGAELLEG